MFVYELLVIQFMVTLTSAQSNTTNQEEFLPWQPSPDIRGTIDIVWSCLFTIFICVWTAIHLNVPAPPETDTSLDLWIRRLKWVCNTIIVPEVVMLFAAGQWSAAKSCHKEMLEILKEQDAEKGIEAGTSKGEKSVVENKGKPPSTDTRTAFEKAQQEQEQSRPKLKRSETLEQREQRRKDERWTLRHAFFANMGGWRLRDKTGVLYLITAKHINFLVRHQYIPLPKITSLEINDRSKSDSLTKFLAVMQVGWLAVQVVARAIQHLETTSLEITTLSFVICTFGTFIAWYRKPYDVYSFIEIEMPNWAISELNMIETRNGKTYDLVKDYVRVHPKGKVVDANGKLVPPYNNLKIIDDGLPSFTSDFSDVVGHFWGRKPYDPDRIRNDRLPLLEKQMTVLIIIITLGYAGLHVAAWNIPLVTKIEQTLWRISSLILVGCVVVWFSMDHFQEYVEHRRKKKHNVQIAMAVPVWRILASLIVTVFYTLARGYVVIESFLALRSLPASAYQQVDWGKWVPHV